MHIRIRSGIVTLRVMLKAVSQWTENIRSMGQISHCNGGRSIISDIYYRVVELLDSIQFVFGDLH